MKSVWEKDVVIPEFDELRDNIKTDVLIIGGGIAGILCAYMLKKSGIDCVIAEADRVCGGITKNTTAKITVQHGLIFDKLINEFGIENAKLYFKANMDALSEYNNLCKDMDCDFKQCDSYVYSLKNKNIIEREISAIESIGGEALFEERCDLPIEIVGAVRMKNQAQFHPLKFLGFIANGLKIFEKTRVIEIKNNEAITKKGRIYANKFIVTTHFPFINKYGGYFLKLYQHRSYVLAVQNVPLTDGMYVDEAKDGLSFRSFKDMLLIGGGSHRTGKEGGNWGELQSFVKSNYPGAREVFRFATQDCMTLDGIPYIGLYSKQIPNLYVATGFNKWGMTSSMVSAKLLSDMIQGKETLYSKVFSPSRNIFHTQLAINAFESIKGLITPTVPRCPHLGCALKYNKYEHSWDCSCHGSRFSETGELIDNPATSGKNDIHGA